MKAMLDFLRSVKKKREEIFCVLDIGTEAVKALLCQINQGKIAILGNSLEYFDEFGAFDSQDFQADILKKTIFRAIKASCRQRLKEKNLPGLQIILDLPANFLKGRIISQFYQRENPKTVIGKKEETVIYQAVLEAGKKAIYQIAADISGILPQDVQFIDLKILGTEIDGYPVSVLQGYSGRNLSFRILATFLPKFYLEEIKNICLAISLKLQRIVHEVWGLTFFLKDNPDAIFLDLGGEVSRIFLTKNGRLELMSEFEMGGKVFSRVLSEKLGINSAEARILKERYGKKELSKESEERIKEILYLPSQNWFKSFRLKLEEMIGSGLLPPKIILFGGASSLPDVQEILRNSNWESFSLIQKPKIEIFNAANLNIIGVQPKDLNTSQNVPPLLIATHYVKKDY